MTSQQTWSSHVTMQILKIIIFSLILYLILGKSLKFGRIWFINKRVTGKKQNSGWKTPIQPLLIGLTLFEMGFFEPSVIGGHEGPHYNFVVIVPMIMKFGTDVTLDVFYTMVTKGL